ncbi:uncharacterized protein TNCV_725261 [Trichonephila clavipes]|nr:uncharacterized protein TNCV_725261 [Trichonephila clavipes]
MTAQRYVHDLPQPMCFYSCNGSQEPFFNKIMLRTVKTLPWPARSPDLSPIEHIWDPLGRRVGHPTSLNELEVKAINHGAHNVQFLFAYQFVLFPWSVPSPEHIKSMTDKPLVPHASP